MTRELKTILICSVVFCLFYMFQLSQEAVPSINKHLFSGVAAWQPPFFNKLHNADDAIAATGNPMAACFFENANLKGFIRNAADEWCAIFDTPTGEAHILEPGITKAGLTLMSANGRSRYCRVKFGSVIREFKL